MRFLFVFMMLFQLIGCQQSDEEKTSQRFTQPEGERGVVIARVGGEAFYESDIDMAFTLLPENIQSLRDDLHARAQILHTLIRRYVLSQKAMDMELGQAPVLRYQIEEARNDILINALQTQTKDGLEEPTDKDIADYFSKNKKRFQIPEQVHIRHIIVATRDEALQVIKQINDGADFSELASKLSLDENSKVRGGDLNWFGRGVMDKAFEDAVFSLKKEGEISTEFQTQFGWHVAELIAKKEKIQKTLEDSTDEIQQQIQHQALQQWLDALVEDKKVQMIRTEYSIEPQRNTADSDSSI